MPAPTRAALDARLTDVEARVTALELGLAAPIEPRPRAPFYAHLPYGAGIGATDWAAMTRERIEAGWATGAFLYSGGAFTWGPAWDAFVEEFPVECDLFLSPKSLAGLDTFLGRFPQSFRDRMVIAYYQEPEDNHTTPAARADFRAKVTEAAAIVRPHGVRNAVEVQSWTLVGPAHGGTDALLDMIPPESVDVVGWSAFNWTGNDVGEGYVGAAAAFMAEHLPGIGWGAASVGWSVPQGTPAGDPLRATRATHASNALAAATAAGAEHLSWYDVPVGNSDRDFGVDPELLPVLVAASA